MKKNDFLKYVIAILFELRKTMALTLLMLILTGTYASAQCDGSSIIKEITTFTQVGATTSSGGGNDILNGDFTNSSGKGVSWLIYRNSGNGVPTYLNIDCFVNGGYACYYLIGEYPSTGTGTTVLDSWNSTTGFNQSTWISIDLNKYPYHAKYYFVMSGAFSSGNMKMTCSSTPLYPQSSTLRDASDPKIPTFTTIADSPATPEEANEHVLVPVFQAAAAWGDFNNDGYLDLLTAGVSHPWTKETTLYKNNGDGTFTKIIENPFFFGMSGNVTWLDYNNDGYLDVFIYGNVGSNDERDQISGLYKNLGPEGDYAFEEVFGGEFVYVDNGGGNRSNRGVAVADFDNDGWVDIYIQGENGDGRHSILYKNLGGMMFNPMSDPVMGKKDFIQLNAGSTVWADMNNDGFLDLIVSGYTQGTDSNYPGITEGYIGAIYMNNGDGTFAEPYLFDGTEEGDLLACDFNNDGKLDFAVIGVSAKGGWHWPGDIYFNNGDGTYTVQSVLGKGFPAGKQANSFAAGDLNNDGLIDILYMNADPNSVLLNNGMSDGEISFTKVAVPEKGENDIPNTNGGTACLVDYNNDRNLDLFTTGYFFTAIYKNELGDGIPENTPPSVPTNLGYTVNSDGDIVFTWDASTDDHTPQAALQYNLFIQKAKTNEIVSILPADIETGRLKVNENLAALTTTFYTLKSWTLEKGDKYGVQAIDNAKNGGLFLVKTVGEDNSLPSIAKDNIKLSVSGKTIKVNAAGTGNVEVYAVSGLKIAQSVVNTNIELSQGVYIVKVTTTNGSLIQKVAIK